MEAVWDLFGSFYKWILAVAVYLCFYVKVFLRISQKFKNERNNVLYLGYINLLFIILFDFFMYSNVTIHQSAIYALFLFVSAYLYRGNETLPYLQPETTDSLSFPEKVNEEKHKNIERTFV
jgi:hypothetical protein